MIGSKKLSKIREEIEDAVGDDPLRWLEDRMAKPEGKSTDVLQSLKRFLEKPAPKRRQRRVKAKK